MAIVLGLIASKILRLRELWQKYPHVVLKTDEGTWFRLTDADDWYEAAMTGDEPRGGLTGSYENYWKCIMILSNKFYKELKQMERFDNAHKV